MPEMLIGDPEMINIYMGGEKIKIGYSNLTQDLILWKIIILMRNNEYMEYPTLETSHI